MIKKSLLLLLVVISSVTTKTSGMEVLKTTVSVFAGVTTIGIASDIFFDKLRYKNFKFVTKNYIKDKCKDRLFPIIFSLACLVPAMHMGSKQPISVGNLIKPASYALIAALTSAAAFAGLVYHLEDDTNKKREALDSGECVFNILVFCLAPVGLAYTMNGKRH